LISTILRCNACRRLLDLYARARPEEKKIATIIANNGSFSIGGHVLLHRGKVANKVKDLLIEEQMLRPFLEEIVGHVGADDYLPVPAQASNLILSCIADKIASREGIDTVTDEELDFAATSMNSLSVPVQNSGSRVEGALLSAVAAISIPEAIDDLTIADFSELRESYAPIRAAFQKYLTDLSSINRLGRISDQEILIQRIGTTAQEITRECDEYAKLKYTKRFKRWAPFAAGSLISIGAAIAAPHIAIVFALCSMSVGVLKKVFFEEPGTPLAEPPIRLLCDLRSDIISRATIEALS